MPALQYGEYPKAVIRAIILLAVLGLGPTTLLAAAVGLAFIAYAIWKVDPAYTLTGAIVLSPLAGNWQQFGIPGPVSPDRLLLAAGIAQVLFRAPAIADRPRLRLVPAHALLGLAAIYALSSALFAGTLFQRAPLLKIVDAFGILPFLAFTVAPLAFRTERQRAVLLVALVALGAYLGLTTLFEIVHLDALVFPKYILDPNYGIHAGRGRGPFVDAVANGFGLFACTTACGVALGIWKRRGPRLAAGLVAILCIVGVLAAQERSVWIGAAVATVLTMAATRHLRRFLVPTLAVTAVAIGAALVLVPGLEQQVKKRYNDKATLWDRQNLAVAAVNMIEARPLLGFGWSRAQNDSADYFRQSQDYPLTATWGGVHNYVLLYAVELGLPGVTLWVLGLLTGVGQALLTRGPPEQEAWRTGLLAIFLMYIVVANFVPPTMFPNILLWLWAGVVLSRQYVLQDR